MQPPANPQLSPQSNAAPPTLSVAEFVRITNGCLQNLGTAWVMGEISEPRQYSNNLYFKLKDEFASCDCLIFRGTLARLGFVPAAGMQVLLSGRSSVYEKNCSFKLIVNSMQQTGQGLILERLRKLKEKLAQEGVFELNRRPLPQFVDCVGVITSLEGEVVHDICTTLKRRNRGIQVRVYNAKVQGADAPATLIGALRQANAERRCEVLIIGRGGGSLEDLLAFSDEALVREVACSAIPIISAVGHEPDEALTDYSADVRAPTPTAAAELISVPTEEQLQQGLQELLRRMQEGVERELNYLQMQWQHYVTRLRAAGPQTLILQRHSELDALKGRLEYGLERVLQRDRLRVQHYLSRLHSVEPGRQVLAQQAVLQQLHSRLQRGMELGLQHQMQRLSGLRERLWAVNPQPQVEHCRVDLKRRVGELNALLRESLLQQQRRLRELVGQLQRLSPENALQERRERLSAQLSALIALNPLSVLKRGYSVTLDEDGKAVSLESVKVGQRLTTLLHGGKLHSVVEDIDAAGSASGLPK